MKKSNEMVIKEQCALHKGTSSLDQVFVVRQECEKNREETNVDYSAFKKLEKVYHSLK